MLLHHEFVRYEHTQKKVHFSNVFICSKNTHLDQIDRVRINSVAMLPRKSVTNMLHSVSVHHDVPIPRPQS